MKAIKRIQKLLDDDLRDLCFFTLGINTAYRANELLSLKVGDVDYLRAGDVLGVKQTKTKKHRSATLNDAAAAVIEGWLTIHPNPVAHAPLFTSGRGSNPVTVSWMRRNVKEWCSNVGLRGNFGTHTLRKTWGFQQLSLNKETPPHMVMPLLMEAYGHTSQQQTLEYLCIQSDEVAILYQQVQL